MKLLVLILGIIFVNANSYLVYRFQYEKEFQKEIRYCGIVTYKSADQVEIKNGHDTELYLGFKNEITGELPIKVGINTYMTHKVGDEICFKLSKDDIGKESSGSGICIVLCLVFDVLLFIGGIVYLSERSDL